MESREEKREIRKKILALRDGMGSDERRRASLLLTERIAGHQWFYGSDYFLCFVSYGSEISTLDIIEEALKSGRKVYVPKVHCGQVLQNYVRQGTGTRIPGDPRTCRRVRGIYIFRFCCGTYPDADARSGV